MHSKFIYNFEIHGYRKVASSRLVCYNSIFDHSGGQPRRASKRYYCFVHHLLCALKQNLLKSVLFSCKCISSINISKNSDRNSWGSPWCPRIPFRKVDDFHYFCQLRAWSNTFSLLLTETCYY